jgi:hypothetical protein
MRGTLSNKCKEREDIPLFSNTKVGSVACIDLCPLFLKKVGKFIICKGKVKNA